MVIMDFIHGSSEDFDHLPLQEREGNRKAAEDEPALLDAL